MAQAAKKNITAGQAPAEMTTPFVVLWLVLLSLVSVYIRVSGVGDYYYSADELMHIVTSQGSGLGEVLSYSMYDAHPPVEYILRHYWMMISEAPWFIRSLPLLFGIALIPVYYKIGNLLGGRFTGLICAALIAFSHGMIIQSFVARGYTIFLFFLSLGFYYFIEWHRSGTFKSLLAYGCFCGLACLTHFSGLFAVFAMAAGELLRIFVSRAPARIQVQWIGVNFAIALAEGVAAYFYWQPELIDQSMSRTFAHPYALLLSALFYPLDAFYSVFHSYGAAVIIALIFPFAYKKGNKEQRELCLLTLIALAVGALLFLSGYYPFGPSRHSLWIAPFIVGTTGFILGMICDWIETRWPYAHSRYVMAAGIFILGLASYQPAARFADHTEYTLTQNEWQQLSQYLHSLNAHSLIVAERADAFLLNPPGVNLYTLMAPGEEGAIAPYGDTHLLFRTGYNKFDGATLVRLLEGARAKGWLEGVDTLVFVHTSVMRSSISSLMTCGYLDRKIIPFSDKLAPGAPASGDEAQLRSYPVTAMELPLPEFFDMIASPYSAGHLCLSHGGKARTGW